MRARSPLVLVAMLSSLSLAQAQKIPNNELPGRERERFIDSPGDRFMKPGPYVAPSVVDAPPKAQKRRARRSKSHQPR